MIYLTNTLSGKKEEFKPIKAGTVGMYSCGPTVYDFAHLGNLRAYVFTDILRRIFEYNGYDVNQVMNITDVGHLVTDGDEGEDKMTKALIREGKPLNIESMTEVATFYFAKFREDLASLNIEMPKTFPRATEHIPEIIELIKKLDQKGFVYKTSDGLYFDTSKFPAYGKLGNINLEGLKEGARVTANTEKKNPIDFAVWKFNPLLGWDTPWGKGFPGWHIECSAMSVKYLGQPFDVHTGGIDHIPVHHNNEIAQSESAEGVPLADYWIHNAHLNMNGGKMAKSAGNFLTLKSLEEKGISPLAYKFWLLGARYSTQINFVNVIIDSLQKGFGNFLSAIKRIYAETNNSEGTKISEGNINEKYKKEFTNFVNDDLDTPKALALTWNLLRDTGVSPADKIATILDFDRVFGLNLANSLKTETISIPENVQKLAEDRHTARIAKDWKKSDELRAEIEKNGFSVIDTNEGYSLMPLGEMI
ncbi:MAG: cysteine--tRNA ligase [bacterium]